MEVYNGSIVCQFIEMGIISHINKKTKEVQDYFFANNIVYSNKYSFLREIKSLILNNHKSMCCGNKLH